MERFGLLSGGAAVLVFGTILSLYPSADARLRALPLPNQLKNCYLRAQNYSIQNYVGSLYCWYCEAQVRSYIKRSPNPEEATQHAYYRELYKKVEPYTKAGHLMKRKDLRAPCIRKEYRMLTDNERRRFHAALNALKRDTTVKPNKYDALAKFHTGVNLQAAHDGPGFIGWHTVILVLIEAALQEVDPKVCLPYWDTSLENGLANPSESYVWSDDFFGSPKGEVTRGPLANWKTLDGTILKRNVGGDGELFSRKGIEDIMSRNTYEEISVPPQDPQYSLEIQHGGTHLFVGGHVEDLKTASNDIIFFMHHAFVDYIWQMFRDKMKNNGLNPEIYPKGAGINYYHLPDAPTGFGNITQADAYLDSLRGSFQYQPSPECSRNKPDCGSKYLWCNVTVPLCVPIDPNNPPVPMPGPNPKPVCPSPKPLAYQNSFCVDGVCDVNLWVWVPVMIVAQRPPEFHDYQSYPVTKGKVSKFSDIYDPSAYNDTNRYIKQQPTKPKSYNHCEVKDGVGRIFVSSSGVNYDGRYKESAIIDQRLATSIGVTYIAVKDPGPNGVSEVILRAHDQCGRICHTACKVPGTNPARYEACSGVVEVTAQHPRQYGQTYAQATLDVYDYASNSDFPAFNTDDFFLTFYCDYRDHIPWVNKSQNPIIGPQRPRPTPVVRSSNSNQCRVSAQCTINQKCDTAANSNFRQCDQYMEMHACENNCGRYAVCIYGVYSVRSCPSGMHFDEVKGHCVRGGCPNTGVPTTGGIFRPREPPSFPSGPSSMAFGSRGLLRSAAEQVQV